jgi:hypothetical protein
MPRIQTPVPSVSHGEVFLATDPTRWEFLLEAAAIGAFPGTKSLKIAQRSSQFKGQDTAARDHADRLAAVGILDRVKTGRRVSYAIGLKGKAIYARVLQLEHASPVRTQAETRLLALVIRVGGSGYDTFELSERLDQELAAELTAAAIQARRNIPVNEV